MAEPKQDISYLDHDVDVLRALIRRGIESGPSRPVDFDAAIREADEELKSPRASKWLK